MFSVLFCSFREIFCGFRMSTDFLFLLKWQQSGAGAVARRWLCLGSPLLLSAASLSSIPAGLRKSGLKHCRCVRAIGVGWEKVPDKHLLAWRCR